MFALASLATGFVVAAVTPSHAVGGLPAGLNVTDALSNVEVLDDSLAPHDPTPDDRTKH
ncbi:hypothetical protein GCM10023220_20910 [Streptomyces ziwulingensis]|uniref:Secreted protein n=2 Tax=Streptomyces ziwulingensis TaxID=1045501 RepID=A0ABP9BEU1_9ACTN